MEHLGLANYIENQWFVPSQAFPLEVYFQSRFTGCDAAKASEIHRSPKSEPEGLSEALALPPAESRTLQLFNQLGSGKTLAFSNSFFFSGLSHLVA
jgi:hypothetical protein